MWSDLETLGPRINTEDGWESHASNKHGVVGAMIKPQDATYDALEALLGASQPSNSFRNIIDHVGRDRFIQFMDDINTL